MSYRLFALFLLATAAAAADHKNFVACPIVRDTKTVPCWLAEYEGELYFLGIQEDVGAAWYPPQLGHRVLVEGTVAGKERICGGIPLKPLATSVIAELDRSCNTVLPVEDGIEAPPAPRGPGPSKGRNLIAQVRPPDPAPPFAAKRFEVLFDFDNDYISARTSRIVDNAAHYAELVHAKRVEVKGYGAGALLSNGKLLQEQPSVPQARATRVADALRAYGIAASVIDATWQLRLESGNGIDDANRRRVEITVKP